MMAVVMNYGAVARLRSLNDPSLWAKYTPKKKDEAATLTHEEATADVEAFLAKKGNKIKTIPYGESNLLLDGRVRGVGESRAVRLARQQREARISTANTRRGRSK